MRKTIVFAAIVGLFVTMSPFVSQAGGVSTDVYITPNIDKKLQVEGSTYFHYDVSDKVGKTVDMSITVRNIKDEVIEAEIELGNGLTGVNSIIYPLEKETDRSGHLNESRLLENIIIDLPEKITLKPNETRVVKFKAVLPEDANGMYAGAIRFIQPDSETDVTDKESASIQIKTAFTIGLWLNAGNVTEGSIAFDSLDLNDKKKTLELKMENDKNTFSKDNKVIYEVIRKKDGEVIMKDAVDVKVIAPSSYYKLPIKWDGEYLVGKYLFKVNDDEFDFEIKKVAPVKKYEEENTIVIEKTKIPWFMWIAPAVLFLLIGGMAYEKRKKRKRKDT